MTRENKQMLIIFDALFVVVLFMVLLRSDIDDAAVVISHDYETITYDGDLYVPVSSTELPKDLDFDIEHRQWIDATVEGVNYFLDKFCTDYVFPASYGGKRYLYLETDYDVNESDYYIRESDL